VLLKARSPLHENRTKVGEPYFVISRVVGGQFLLGDLEREGQLEVGQILRLRVRYFTDGVGLRSRNYVNEVFAAHRDRFGPRRKTGARRVRGLTALGDLVTLRDLRVDAVG
jgi:hypothetical protein